MKFIKWFIWTLFLLIFGFAPLMVLMVIGKNAWQWCSLLCLWILAYKGLCVYILDPFVKWFDSKLK